MILIWRSPTRAEKKMYYDAHKGVFISRVIHKKETFSLEAETPKGQKKYMGYSLGTRETDLIRLTKTLRERKSQS
jgi:hypothetical protein